MSLELSPAERDRLLLFTTAELARARRARGLLLNVPEATAIVADAVCEAARDGATLAEALAAGRSVLTRAEVMPGVPEIVGDVQVEAVFDDGTRLAVVTEPFGQGRAEGIAPGEILPAALPEPELGTVISLEVLNTSSVPISVTSHFHFFEVNPRLRFDRAASYGHRLAIEAGAALRFDPGETVRVELAPIAGERVVIGFAGLVDGPLDDPEVRRRALEKARATGYLGAEEGG